MVTGKWNLKEGGTHGIVFRGTKRVLVVESHLYKGRQCKIDRQLTAAKGEGRGGEHKNLRKPWEGGIQVNRIVTRPQNPLITPPPFFQAVNNV